MKRTVECRLHALESARGTSNLYDLPPRPGQKRLPVLIPRGPTEQADLESARARGYAAELDTPENCARWL